MSCQILKVWRDFTYVVHTCAHVCLDSNVCVRHGAKYIEMYLNTNTLELFKYKYF